MKRISAERKEAVIKKMLPPLSMSINELVEVEGISRASFSAIVAFYFFTVPLGLWIKICC